MRDPETDTGSSDLSEEYPHVGGETAVPASESFGDSHSEVTARLRGQTGIQTGTRPMAYLDVGFGVKVALKTTSF